MPLYNYHCKECDTVVELLTGFGETPACPRCGAQAMERLMSRPAAPGKSKAIMKAARAQAGREGHLSNFSASELKG